MTKLNHLDKISHPGYGEGSEIWNRRNDFFFSDDIQKWIRAKQYKYVKKKDRK